MSASTARRDPPPFGELNTTPLIDVLLVLLILFILSIPVGQHQVSFDLPSPQPVDSTMELRRENMLSLTAAGTIRWNGTAISEAQLVTLLSAAKLQNPEPLIRFEPEGGAPYGASLRVLNLVKASDPAAFAFSGNKRYAGFAKAEPAPR
ncbi:MAG TPA: biopolymer transporter ExbD [Novosphingobium sp.]|nr:biopolymer transporter ExbD [Novosphingobium sp.]